MVDEAKGAEVAEAVEDDDDGGRGSAKTFLAGLGIGILVGAGLALLFAPRSGVETRKAVSRKARRLAREARERYEDLRERARRDRARREEEPASAE